MLRNFLTVNIFFTFLRMNFWYYALLLLFLLMSLTYVIYIYIYIYVYMFFYDYLNFCCFTSFCAVKIAVESFMTSIH